VYILGEKLQTDGKIYGGKFHKGVFGLRVYFSFLKYRLYNVFL